jgi:hypothetical protein
MSDFTTFPKRRFGLVTGSKCSVLFPQKGDGKVGKATYARTLAKELFFQFYDEMSSRETEHGKMAEHFAFEHYQTYVDKTVEPGRFIDKGDCGGSTDAETKDRVIDFKCPVSLQAWLDYLDGIDRKQEDQLRMYMYLTGKDKAEIAAYLIETQWMTDNGIVYPVKEEKRMIRVEIVRNPEWEEELFEVVPEIIKVRDEYVEKYKALFE